MQLGVRSVQKCSSLLAPHLNQFFTSLNWVSLYHRDTASATAKRMGPHWSRWGAGVVTWKSSRSEPQRPSVPHDGELSCHRWVLGRLQEWLRRPQRGWWEKGSCGGPEAPGRQIKMLNGQRGAVSLERSVRWGRVKGHVGKLWWTQMVEAWRCSVY